MMIMRPVWGECITPSLGISQRILRRLTEQVAKAKLTSRLGEPLALGPTGRVPQGCYFVTSEHKDGFDSRYAAIGWICGPRILGVGRPIL